MSESNGPQEFIPVKDIPHVDQMAPAEVSEADPLTRRREKIYTRKIEGFFQRIRLYSGWPLLLGFFLAPWLTWNGHQAIWFNLPERKFYIMGLTFWPQDFPLLAWLLIIAAFALFAVTVWAGRIWCGYTCPQTVWTAIFMWAEQLAEGSRSQRMKLDQQPMNAEKALRKGAKHLMWIGFSFLTGFTFVAYFAGAPDLARDFGTLNLSFWEIAWVNFFTMATYINAGWLRESVCMFICPYARFQSVMFDKDTLVVSYDKKRGDPRGARKRGAPKPEGKGDCIDCELCVQVCPVGIDIRNGLQYQCINCALCIDACNSVMDKVGYERGLIRYATEHELEGQPVKRLRPRLVGYAFAVLAMFSLFGYTLLTRIPLNVDVIKDRGLYRETNDGWIENVYTVKIMNKDQSAHVYTLEVKGIDGLRFDSRKGELKVESGEVLELPVRVAAPPDKIADTESTITITVSTQGNVEQAVTKENRFIAPPRG